MNTFTIKKDIFVDVAPEVVFDALTTAEEIVKYFPLQQVISEWKEGGDVYYKGELNGQEFTDYGVIDVFSRPGEYTYTYWSDNHGTEKTPENHLVISYRMTIKNTGTQIELEQSNIRSEEMFEIMDTVVWDSLLGKLKKYVEFSI